MATAELIKEICAYFGMLATTVGTILGIYKKIKDKFEKAENEKKAKEEELHDKVSLLMKSQQLQLRKILLNDYITASKRGSITAADLQDWEEVYQSYHSLGENGVMDAKREEMLKLPVVINY